MPVIATQPLLDDARAKYHALMTGTSARVLVDQNGEKVEFTAAKKQDLYNYIGQLEAQLAPVSTPADMRPYHPATFVF
jgi:hypothetical protein